MTLDDRIRKKIEDAFAAARVADVPRDIDCSREADIELIPDEKLQALIAKIPNLPPRGRAATPAVGKHRNAAHHINRVYIGTINDLYAKCLRSLARKS